MKFKMFVLILVVLLSAILLSAFKPYSPDIVCQLNEVMVNGLCYPKVTCMRNEVMINGLCYRIRIPSALALPLTRLFFPVVTTTYD